MSERGQDRWEAAIAATWDRVRLAWKCLAYGIDGSGNAQPLKVNADGQIDVNVISGGSPATAAAVFYDGNVTAASLSSDHTWTLLVSNVSSIPSSHYEIGNWSDKWLEIAFNDSPNSSSGIDIDMLWTPWTVKPVPLGSDLTLATDIYVRRFDGTPTLGYVAGSIIHDGGV